MHPFRQFARHVAFISLTLAAVKGHPAATSANKPTPGDLQLKEYFRSETLKVEAAGLEGIKTLADWNARRDTYRQQLFEMLGLSPLPPKTDLKPVITGKLDHELFTVEKLHYQSMPGFYVTANLYVPKNLAKPAPAILYVCGHAVVKTNGVSLGNKAGYQHHGAWFARNGYVCLTIDTVQLGELEGIHHGTYREGMWWWNARGYSSAGAEAWNCIRALDYLQSRPEVDASRIGVTGRSGGGAYSWWIAALDDRIKAACPVAGITDLHNHVVDGTVQGHCDCMFMVNTYRWEYAQVAALVAPRPLLVCNTDKDSIFPLEGVVRIHEEVRNIYQLHNAGAKLGLLITEGPHKDTQDLQVPVFRWFNRHLKGEEPLIAMPAEKLFTPKDLKVLSGKPPDERTTTIHETFVPLATNPVPGSLSDWNGMRTDWMTALREKCFRGWPAASAPPPIRRAFDAQVHGLRFAAYDFESQRHASLRLYVLEKAGAAPPARVKFEVLDAPAWAAWLPAMRSWLLQAGGAVADLLHEEAAVLALMATNNLATAKGDYSAARIQAELADGRTALVFLAPRGIGLTAWNPTVREAPHIRRRFMLLGQTLDSMRVWDIRRGLQAVRQIKGFEAPPLTVAACRNIGVDALYAALFEPRIGALELEDIPASHRGGPDYLNVLRFLDVPQALAMIAETSTVQLAGADTALRQYFDATAKALSWPLTRVKSQPGR